MIEQRSFDLLYIDNKNDYYLHQVQLGKNKKKSVNVCICAIIPHYVQTYIALLRKSLDSVFKFSYFFKTKQHNQIQSCMFLIEVLFVIFTLWRGEV